MFFPLLAGVGKKSGFSHVRGIDKSAMVKILDWPESSFRFVHKTVGAYRTGEREASPLKAHETACTLEQGQQQQFDRNLSQTDLLVLEGPGGSRGCSFASHAGEGAGEHGHAAVILGDIQQNQQRWQLISWPVGAKNLPHTKLAPGGGAETGCLKPSNQLGFDTAPPIRRQAA